MKKVIIETVALVSVVGLSYGYDFNFDKAGGSITLNEIKLDASHIKVDRSKIPWWVSGAIILPGENRLMLSSGSGSTTINADGAVKLQINVPPNHSVSRSCGWGITDPAGKELCNVRITQEGGADNKVSPIGIATPETLALSTKYRSWGKPLYITSKPIGDGDYSYHASETLSVGGEFHVAILLANLSDKKDYVDSVKWEVPEANVVQVVVFENHDIPGSTVHFLKLPLESLSDLEAGTYTLKITVNHERKVQQSGVIQTLIERFTIADSLSEQEKDESDKDSDDEGLEGDDESAQGEVLLPDKRISDIAKFIQTTPFKDIPLEKDPGPISAAWAEMFELYQNNWNILGRDGIEAYEQRRNHHNSIRSRLLSRLVEMNSIFANGAKTGEFEDVNNRHEFGNEYVHLLVAIYANFKEGRDSSALNNFLNDFRNENEPKLVWHSNLMVVKSWLQNEKDKSVQLLKVSDANQQTPLAKLSKQQLEEILENEKQYEERMKVDHERTMLDYRRISSKAYPSKHDSRMLRILSSRLRSIEKQIRESQKRQNAIRGQIAQGGEKDATAEDPHKGETSSKEFKFCTKCGKKASAGDNFCGGCGNKF